MSVDDILSERASRYGSFWGNADISRELREVVFRRLGARGLRLRPDSEEAIVAICQKLARIINGDPEYDDNWIDIAGYATLVANRIQSDKHKRDASLSQWPDDGGGGA